MGAGFQTTVAKTAEFIETFSGLAEIMKGADQHFGNIAYGTFAVLLSVAAHKQQREEEIEGALEELAIAFPRLKTLESLEPGNGLRA